MVAEARDPFLCKLGERVRAHREERALSRVALAGAARLSPRFLADLEAGAGNISIARLAMVAAALGIRTSSLLAEAEDALAVGAPGIIALLGLRGAGKSTIGAALARRLEVPFTELDDLVAAAAGIPLAQIFELHGEDYYRRIERDELARYLIENGRGVLATGGGIVTVAGSFELLRQHAVTVWLRARPRDHWHRVLAQGDERPMADRAQAMEELQQLLAARAPLYARARFDVDTSSFGVEASVDRIVDQLETGASAT